MSFMIYNVKCKKCGEIHRTAFGIVGMTQIAAPLEKCPTCGGELEKEQEKIEEDKMFDRLCLHCVDSSHHLEIWYDDEYDQLYVSHEVKSRGIWSAIKEAW